MRLRLIYLLFCIGDFLYAQDIPMGLGRFDEVKFHEVYFESHVEQFSHTRPFLKSEYKKFINDYEVGGIEVKNHQYKFLPIGNLSTFYDDEINISGSFGLWTNLELSEDFTINGFYRYVYEPRYNYLENSVFLNNSLNGYNFAEDSANQIGHHYEVNANYKLGKYFIASLGNGKQHWGEGYRSFFISDFAAPYPYFRLKTTFWRVQYTNLFSWHKDNGLGFSENKFSASHQISWNILDNLNLSIFETVIWAGTDSLGQRNFDVNYLNPIVFYRPVEYAQGSADNVLLGAQLVFRTADKFSFYGQFLLDEFFLPEIRDNKGWWANKYALQAGVKSRNLFGIENLFSQLEYNVSRPFTYSHKSSSLNYGHKGQSLAHPLSANFNEVILRLMYQKDGWNFTFKSLYISRGLDYDNGVSQGGNIYVSYTARDREYGHNTLQGNLEEVYIQQLVVEKLLSEKYNLNGFLKITDRIQKGGVERAHQQIFEIGIRSGFWRNYDDF